MLVDSEILKAVAVTAELTGTEITELAAKVFAADLAEYPKAAVMAALTRCRRELKGRLTLSDVLTRIAETDGRPSADEAWALCPFDESATVVWTDEMAHAWGIALPMLDSDKTAARMAFRSAYGKAVDEARQAGARPQWRASLGHDKAGREAPIRQAVELGRLSDQQATHLLPDMSTSREMLQIAQAVVGKLPSPDFDAKKAAVHLASIRQMMRNKAAGGRAE